MRLSSVTHDSGLRCDYSWDQPGMDATTIQWSFGPNPLLTFSYEFRPDGKPEQQTATDPARSLTETVEYEPHTHRIKKVEVDTPALPSRSHIYDPAGNREIESVTGGPSPGNFLYSYNFVNELIFWQGGPSPAAWTYDEAGNLTRDFRRIFAWDGAGRLRTIGYLGTADESRFRYDGTGRLTEQEELANGVTTQSTVVWSGDDALAELSDSGATAHFLEGVVTGCTRRVRRIQVQGMTRARGCGSGGGARPRVAKSAPFWEITR